MTHLHGKKITKHATNIGFFCLFPGVWVGCYQTCTGNSYHLQGPGQPTASHRDHSYCDPRKITAHHPHAARTMLLISTLPGDKH